MDRLSEMGCNRRIVSKIGHMNELETENQICDTQSFNGLILKGN